MKKYDWIIIGGGSGGLSVVETALEFNKKCLLVDTNPLGGTCVNVGCVPKKMMWYLSEVYEKSQLLKDYQITPLKQYEIRFSDFVANRQELIKKINEWYESQIGGLADVVRGKAQLVGPGKVLVNDRIYQGERIVLATGSSPIMPKQIPGNELGIVSDGFFDLTEIPQSMVIVGSGYIALEIASIVASLQKMKFGRTDVTIVVRSERVLKNIDDGAAKFLQQQLSKKGICFLFRSVVKNVKTTHKQVQIKLESYEKNQTERKPVFKADEYIITDVLLWAIGRTPNTKELKLGVTKIVTDPSGYIETDNFFETLEPNHYALGDVTNKPQLTPVAVQSGRRLVRQVYQDKEKNKVNFSVVPTVVFTHPPLATVGLSESQAKEKGLEIECFETKFDPMIFAFTKEAIPTYVKLVCDKKTDQVLGLHLVGENVDEMLQGFAVAIQKGATKRDFDTTFAIHPTSSEEIVTMKPLH